MPVLRAFGASSKFMRDMLRCVDTVSGCAPIRNNPLTSLQNNSCVFSLLLTKYVSKTRSIARITGFGEVSYGVSSTLTNLISATVNRWISVRFNMLSSAIISLTAVVMLLNHRVDAAAAGFALAFITNLTSDLLFLVRRFVALEQAMVAVERIKEFSELQQEPPEFVEPRPPASWPVSLSSFLWLVVH